MSRNLRATRRIRRAALAPITGSLIVGCLLASVLAGCAETPIADADYGRSVQRMVQSQTYDPVAASNPPELAPEVGDGVRLHNALEVYRKDVAQGGAEMKRPIIFDVAQ